jgi:pilus assembly protein CpaC
MHRTMRRSRTWGGAAQAALLALLVGGLAAAGRAQEPPLRGNALIVPIGGTREFKMATGKPIKSATVPNEIIAIRGKVGDPTTVVITGQQPGVAKLTLVDENDKKEEYEVIVQLDVEYLRTQLRRAVPTANVNIIPTSTNTVVLSGTVARSADVDVILRVAQSVGVQVINYLNVAGVQQVQLDVVVADVSRTEFRRMAFNFLTDSKNFFLASTVGNAVTQPAAVGTGAPFSVNGALAAAPGTPNGAPTNFLAGVLHSSWGILGFLQALREEDVVKSMAEPRVITLSGRPASFLAGGEQAVPVPAGLGQVGVQFEEFGIRLNFLPIVLGNGKIHLEVEPEVSALNAAFGTTIQGTTVPGRTTNRVNTTVELETGQTFVIGGLISHDVIGSAEKVPVLGDLPFVGAYFSRKSFQETEREIVILITPHLVDAQSCSQVAKLLPGQETRTPDDFELFLEGILEAPRGPRQVFQGGHYVPAYKNGPTSELFPCAGGHPGEHGPAPVVAHPMPVPPPGSAAQPTPGLAAQPMPTATPLPTEQATAPAPAKPEEAQAGGELAPEPPAPAPAPAPAPEGSPKPTTPPVNAPQGTGTGGPK